MFHINTKKSFATTTGKLLATLHVIICKGVSKCHETLLCIWYMYLLMTINLHVLLKTLILRKKNISKSHGHDSFILLTCACNWWIERVSRVFIDTRGKKKGILTHYLLQKPCAHHLSTEHNPVTLWRLSMNKIILIYYR